jgi:hypothetical protein
MGWMERARRLVPLPVLAAEREARLRQIAAGKVYLGYPSGGSVTLAFHAACLQLLGGQIAKSDSLRSLGKINHCQSLYVADNRNLLVQRMLGSHCDWLLQIDTDISFPPTLLQTMLAIAGADKVTPDYKVLAASVPLGEHPTCAYQKVMESPGIYVNIGFWGHQKPIECDSVATAVLLVHRTVFEDIADQTGQCWFLHRLLPIRPREYQPLNPDGRPLREMQWISQGEDHSFCYRAQEAGHRIWCVHIPGLKHYKTKALSHDEDGARALALEDAGIGELVEEGVV